MPLITIRAFSPQDPTTVPRMLADVQARGAEALQCSIRNIWVTFQTIPEGWYLQSDNPAHNPPIVTIQAQKGRSREQLTRFAQVTAESVASGLGIPATQVWIHYQEMQSEDVWFEGRWSG